jgi:hypothetical protein
VIGSLILANKYAPNSMSFSLNLGGMFGSIVKVVKKLLP